MSKGLSWSRLSCLYLREHYVCFGQVHSGVGQVKNMSNLPNGQVAQKNYVNPCGSLTMYFHLWPLGGTIWLIVRLFTTLILLVDEHPQESGQEECKLCCSLSNKLIYTQNISSVIHTFIRFHKNSWQ